MVRSHSRHRTGYTWLPYSPALSFFQPALRMVLRLTPDQAFYLIQWQRSSIICPADALWGSLFFLFMIFAAMSTVLGVCENILAMVRELTGWSRPKGSLDLRHRCLRLLRLTTALGFNLIHFQPFYGRHHLAGFLGFHRFHQCPPARLSCSCPVLLSAVLAGAGIAL